MPVRYELESERADQCDSFSLIFRQSKSQYVCADNDIWDITGVNAVIKPPLLHTALHFAMLVLALMTTSFMTVPMVMMTNLAISVRVALCRMRMPLFVRVSRSMMVMAMTIVAVILTMFRISSLWGNQNNAAW